MGLQTDFFSSSSLIGSKDVLCVHQGMGWGGKGGGGTVL